MFQWLIEENLLSNSPDPATPSRYTFTALHISNTGDFSASDTNEVKLINVYLFLNAVDGVLEFHFIPKSLEGNTTALSGPS